MIENEDAGNYTEPLETSGVFAERFGKALNSVVANEENRELWERFRYAFEYRGRYPWMGEAKYFTEESEKVVKERALAYALRTALILHNTSLTERMSQDARTELDSDFVDNLTAAMGRVARDPFILESFPHSLARLGFQPDELSVEEIGHEIRQSVHIYWDRSELGLSPDPW